jgi:hypothetical protein
VSISAFLLSLFGKSAKTEIPPDVQAKIRAGVAAVRNDPEFKRRQEELKRSLREDRFDLFIADRPLPSGVVAEVHLGPNHRHTVIAGEGSQLQAAYAQGQLIARVYTMQHQLVDKAVVQIQSNGTATLQDGAVLGLINKTGPESPKRGKQIEKALKTTARESHPELGHGRLLTAEQLSAK